MAQQDEVQFEHKPGRPVLPLQSGDLVGVDNGAGVLEQPAEGSNAPTEAREQQSLLDLPLADLTWHEEEHQRASGPLDGGRINTELSHHPGEAALDAGTEQKGKDRTLEPAGVIPSNFLAELSSLIQQEKYQRLLCRSLTSQVLGLQVASGVSRRLIRCIQWAYRSLVNRYRTDQKDDFVTLYNALTDLQRCCDSRLWMTSSSSRYQIGNVPERLRISSGSWIENLTPESQEHVIGFLTRIRTDPDFLARRITSLPSSELSAVIFPHQSPSVVDSIIHNHSFGKAQTSRNLNTSGYVSFGVDHLRHLHRRDRLSSLLYTVFDDSSEPGSQEDLRRSDVWSTACANILTGAKRGSDRFVETVLDAWASLRTWEIKPQLEAYLVKLLQDGAFLFEPAKGQNTDFGESLAATKSSEFFDQALYTFFELLGTGPCLPCLPGCVLDFARAILRKINDPEQMKKARNDIVLGWYFSKFLHRVIIYPESQGICTNYHITNPLRQKVLKELASRIQKQVSDVVLPWKHTAPVVPEMRAHVERIIHLFHVDDSARPRLSSSTSSSKEEEAGAKPYLLISPSDFATMVHALFPDDRTLSDMSYNQGIDRMDSSASSFTVSSTLTSNTSDPQSALNSSTAPSISGTSITSNTISNVATVDDIGMNPESLRAAALDDSGNSRHGMLEIDEDYGQQLRILCDDISLLVGSNAMAGTCHPAAEDWAIIYIVRGGERLSVDESFEFAGHTDLGSHTEITIDRESGNDYELVKEAAARLVDDRYLPTQLLAQWWPNVIFPRGSREEKTPQRDIMDQSLDDAAAILSSRESDGALPVSEQPGGFVEPGKVAGSGTMLGAVIDKALHCSQARYDYHSAQFWWRSQRALRHLLARSSGCNDDNLLVTQIARDLVKQVQKWRESIEHKNSSLFRLDVLKRYQDSLLLGLEGESKALRDKMWYVSEVVHSLRYDDARNVTLALRAMANPPRGRQRNSGLSSWARHRLRSSIGYDRSDGQTLEAITAPGDHGGPMKLADEQVELTTKWLTERSIENFCKGEERIHRFCFEIQKCVNRLTGESLLKSPDLWSSSLYMRERQTFDRVNREVHNQVPRYPSSGMSAYISDYGGTSNPPRGFSQLYSQPGLGNHRPSPNPANTNPPYQFPWASSKETNADASRYVSSDPGSSTPGAGSREPIPLWSPVADTIPPLIPDTRSKSPTTIYGAGSPFPGMEEPRPGGFGKRAFLDMLRQTLASLLISDLGSLNWGQGSETDRWISDSEGQAFLHTRTDSVRVATVTYDNQASKPLIPKGAMAHEPNAFIRPSVDKCDESLGEGRPHRNRSVEIQQEVPANNKNDEVSPPNPTLRGGKNPESLFPNRQAYSKLLSRFSFSPDPYIKLQMLYELEILASNWPQISVTTDLDNHARSPVSSSARRVGTRGIGVPRTKATRIEEVMANCEDRRATTLQSRPTSLAFSVGEASASSDDVVSVLQSIFDDPGLRPKTLFRDLQYIAAFVPSSILDHSPRGKAFWDAGLAALALKEDHCKSKIELADQIVAYHWKPNDNGSHRRVPNHPNSPSQPKSHVAMESRETSDQSAGVDGLAKYTLSSAAAMYTIAAKEGFPTAARELGLFYLAHPELVQPRITLLPLSKPKDVFRPALTALDKRNKEVNASSSATEGLDPLIFSVAFHWMEVAANGGDKDARTFLKNNSNLSAGW